MSDIPVGRIGADEFAGLVEQFVTERSGHDDRLPGNAFFELLTHPEQPTGVSAVDAERVTVTARVLDGQLSLSAPPGAPIQTEGNRVSWGNGHEVIIELDYAA